MEYVQSTFQIIISPNTTNQQHNYVQSCLGFLVPDTRGYRQTILVKDSLLTVKNFMSTDSYFLDRPKSVNFRWPSSVTRMFSGFKSLYITFRVSCIYSKPNTTSAAQNYACWLVKRFWGYRFMTFRSYPPVTSLKHYKLMILHNQI
jgi:hypothetical protein